MARLILTEAIRDNCAVRFRLVLFFLLLLHHFLVDAVCNQFRILVAAVIVPDILFLGVGFNEVHFYLLYREVSQLQSTTSHVNAGITSFYLILNCFSLAGELVLQFLNALGILVCLVKS